MLHLIWGGNRRLGKEYVLQLLNTEGNRPRNEAYMGFVNGRSTFFSQDYPRCWSVVEALEIVDRTNGAAVEGL